jgi:stage III sporulation protein AF
VSAALSHWGRSLVALALFGLLVELLLPSRQTEGYVRLIVGLVLLTAVVSPVLGLVRSVVAGGVAALPGASARSLAGVLAAESAPGASESTLVAGLFARQVAQAAAARARSVPGVASATARASVGRSGATYGRVTAVALGVVPTREAARNGAALARGVGAAVARSLGLDPAVVHVRLGRPSSGPSP